MTMRNVAWAALKGLAMSVPYGIVMGLAAKAVFGG